MDTQHNSTLPEVHKEGRSEGTTSLHEECDLYKNEVMPITVVKEDYRLLFEAALKGNWKEAQKFLNDNHDAIKATVMTVEDEPVTVLEVAIMGTQDELVEELVKGLPLDYNVDILMSALINASQRGRIRMVKALVDKVHPKTPEIVALALSYAVECAHTQKEVIWYLAQHTTFSPEYETMTRLIMAGHSDIGLYLYQRYSRSLEIEDTNHNSILKGLAKMRSGYPSGARLNFWEKTIYKCIPLCLVDISFNNSENTGMARALNCFKISPWNLATKAAPIKSIVELKLRHNCSLEFGRLALDRMRTPTTLEISGIVLDAASHGISEFVQLCLIHFPQLMWEKNFTKELIKEIVKGRHVELFRLVNAHNTIPYMTYEMWMKDGMKEALLEWSPKCVQPDVPGAAFLVQRELQWFKVLEERSDPSFKSMRFKVMECTSDLSFQSLKLVQERGGKTCWEVFVEQRRDLLNEARQWMKDTSSSCSLVSTLVVTVAFTAAFTVPGGNDNSTGLPIFLKKGSFMVFVVADALALFSSVTATLLFLAIVTPCYAIEDFLFSLPRKLTLGISFLLLSLTFMLVAFSSALTIILSERSKWIYVPITLLAVLLVALLVILQFPLYIDMVESTYHPRLYRPLKLWK